MILLLKEYVSDSLTNITLEKSQIALLNKIYDHVGSVCNQKKIFLVPTKYLYRLN